MVVRFDKVVLWPDWQEPCRPGDMRAVCGVRTCHQKHYTVACAVLVVKCVKRMFAQLHAVDV